MHGCDSSWIHVGSFPSKRVPESSVFCSSTAPGHPLPHLCQLLSLGAHRLTPHTYVVHVTGTEHLKSSLKIHLISDILITPPPPFTPHLMMVLALQLCDITSLL